MSSAAADSRATGSRLRRVPCRGAVPFRFCVGCGDLLRAALSADLARAGLFVAGRVGRVFRVCDRCGRLYEQTVAPA